MYDPCHITLIYIMYSAAQRAFRERKQTQLAELQAKVQQYEQGQIERNVALQNIAKRLKEENEKLRAENTLLQEKLAAAEQERDALREVSKKRWREDSSQSFADLGGPLPKRPRVSVDPFDSFSHGPATPSPYTSSPSSVASSPVSFDHHSMSPMPSLPPSRDILGFPQGSGLSNIFDFLSSGKTNMFDMGGAVDAFDCGLCSDNTPCVCRELAMQPTGDRYNPPLKIEQSEHRVVAVQLNSAPLAPQPAQTSILDNLPAYQPPVPLKRRTNAKSTTNSIFPVTSASSDSPASCTGDPSNCPACADDAFGKAFCAAISKSVASNGPCSSCPSRTSDACGSTSGSGCCGNPAGCCRGRESLPPTAALEPTAAQPSSSATSTDALGSATIPCNDAWRQIKSHPNIAFADLDLLADVVARRSKCTGPRVEIFPAPGTITPERGLSPPTVASHAPEQAEAGMQAASAATRYPGPERDRPRSPSLQLVPQDILVQCGRQRVREVNADGVQDALRLLDLKFALS